MAFFDSGIMIDSSQAELDKQDLSRGRTSLDEAKRILQQMQRIISADWKGTAATQCAELIDGFIRQTEGFSQGTGSAISMLDAIVNTYRDADRALASKM